MPIEGAALFKLTIGLTWIILRPLSALSLDEPNITTGLFGLRQGKKVPKNYNLNVWNVSDPIVEVNECSGTSLPSAVGSYTKH